MEEGFSTQFLNVMGFIIPPNILQKNLKIYQESGSIQIDSIVNPRFIIKLNEYFDNIIEKEKSQNIIFVQKNEEQSNNQDEIDLDRTIVKGNRNKQNQKNEIKQIQPQIFQKPNSLSAIFNEFRSRDILKQKHYNHSFEQNKDGQKFFNQIKSSNYVAKIVHLYQHFKALNVPNQIQIQNKFIALVIQSMSQILLKKINLQDINQKDLKKLIQTICVDFIVQACELLLEQVSEIDEECKSENLFESLFLQEIRELIDIQLRKMINIQISQKNNVGNYLLNLIQQLQLYLKEEIVENENIISKIKFENSKKSKQTQIQEFKGLIQEIYSEFLRLKQLFAIPSKTSDKKIEFMKSKIKRIKKNDLRDIIENLLKKQYHVESFCTSGGEADILKGYKLTEQNVKYECIFRCTIHQNIQDAEKEYNIVKSIKNPINVISYFDVIYVGDRIAVFIAEKCGQNLLEELNSLKIKNKLIDQFQLCQIFFDFIEGGIELRMNNIIHCDIKLSNFLKTLTGYYIYSDFGAANQVKDSSDKILSNKFTNSYASPEQINRQEVTYKTDIYSLGIAIMKLLAWIEVIGNEEAKKIGSSFSQIATNYMKQDNPEERFDYLEILKKFIDLILKKEFYTYLQDFLKKVEKITHLYQFEIFGKQYHFQNFDEEYAWRVQKVYCFIQIRIQLFLLGFSTDEEQIDKVVQDNMYFDKYNIYHIEIAYSFSRIAFYFFQKDKQKALKYFRLSLDLYIVLQNTTYIPQLFRYIANCYIDLDQKEEGLEYLFEQYQKCYQFLKEFSDQLKMIFEQIEYYCRIITNILFCSENFQFTCNLSKRIDFILEQKPISKEPKLKKKIDFSDQDFDQNLIIVLNDEIEKSDNQNKIALQFQEQKPIMSIESKISQQKKEINLGINYTNSFNHEIQNNEDQNKNKLPFQLEQLAQMINQVNDLEQQRFHDQVNNDLKIYEGLSQFKIQNILKEIFQYKVHKHGRVLFINDCIISAFCSIILIILCVADLENKPLIFVISFHLGMKLLEVLVKVILQKKYYYNKFNRMAQIIILLFTFLIFNLDDPLSIRIVYAFYYSYVLFIFMSSKQDEINEESIQQVFTIIMMFLGFAIPLQLSYQIYLKGYLIGVMILSISSLILQVLLIEKIRSRPQFQKQYQWACFLNWIQFISIQVLLSLVFSIDFFNTAEHFISYYSFVISLIFISNQVQNSHQDYQPNYIIAILNAPQSILPLVMQQSPIQISYLCLWKLITWGIFLLLELINILANKKCRKIIRLFIESIFSVISYILTSILLHLSIQEDFYKGKVYFGIMIFIGFVNLILVVIQISDAINGVTHHIKKVQKQNQVQSET